MRAHARCIGQFVVILAERASLALTSVACSSSSGSGGGGRGEVATTLQTTFVNGSATTGTAARVDRHLAVPNSNSAEVRHVVYINC
jgi:hypothetical protein